MLFIIKAKCRYEEYLRRSGRGQYYRRPVPATLCRLRIKALLHLPLVLALAAPIHICRHEIQNSLYEINEKTLTPLYSLKENDEDREEVPPLSPPLIGGGERASINSVTLTSAIMQHTLQGVCPILHFVLLWPCYTGRERRNGQDASKVLCGDGKRI